jgi:cytochrome P450
MNIQFEPFSEETRTDPYPLYTLLREHAPVYWAAGVKAWTVSRYADVRSVLSQPDLFSSDAMHTMFRPLAANPAALQNPRTLAQLVDYAKRSPFRISEMVSSKNLISSDPPVHDRMRKIVARGFTPRQLDPMEEGIREFVRAATEKLRAREEFDAITDLGVPLPLKVITEMLGITPERVTDFKRWSDMLVNGTSGPGRDQDIIESGYAQTLHDFFLYMVDIVRERKRNPAGDLVSTLVRAQEQSDETLSTVDVVLFSLLLLVAGNETVTNLIGNTVCALLRHPGQLRWVNEDREQRIPLLIEESLRYDSPIQFVFRRATRTVLIAGQTIPANATVLALIGSANRDERQFDRAGEFDPSRNAVGHLAFGGGPHFCLGAPLARLEARIALDAVLPELPFFELRPGERRFVDSYLVRGFRSLPLQPTSHSAVRVPAG